MAQTLLNSDNVADNLALPGTGAMLPPRGTTAQRPLVPTAGMIRFNTDLQTEEVYQNGAWSPRVVSVVPAAVQARRSTTFSPTNVATNITFNAVDVVTQAAKLYRDATNTDRIYAAVAGTYYFEFSATITDSVAAQTHTYRLKKNGTTYPDGASDTFRPNTTTTIPAIVGGLVTMAAGDYITVEAIRSSNTGTSTVVAGSTFVGYNLSGTQGPAGANGGVSMLQYGASSFDNPNNAGWASNALAALTVDPATTSLNVRAFDDTLEEGVGFTVYVPPGSSNLVFQFTARAATAPATAVNAIMRLYNRLIPDNAAVGAWSVAYTLSTLPVPANARFQKYQMTVPLSAIGATAGNTYQFELTRQGGSAADTLVGDLYLLNAIISFS